MNALRQLSRALGFAWHAAGRWTLFSGVLLVLQGLLPLVSLYLMKLVVDLVTEGLASGASAGDFQRVSMLIVWTAGVALLAAAVGTLANLSTTMQGQLIIDHMNDLLHAKSAEVDLGYFEDAQYYDTIHRAQSEGPTRPTRIVNGLMQVGQSATSLVALVALVASLHWGVAVVLAASALPAVFVQLYYSGKFYRWSRSRTPLERDASYSQLLLTRDTFAKELRLFNFGELFRERYRRVRRLLLSERFALLRLRSVASMLAQGASTAAVYGSFAFVAHRTFTGLLTVGDLVLYYGAFQRAQTSLRGVLGGLVQLHEDRLYLTNLYEFLDLKAGLVSPEKPLSVPRPMREGIVLNNVSFRYPSGGELVLRNVTLRIRPGEHIALVGENGSGKTTLAKLLMRFYDPTEGSITLDGIDFRRFSVEELRREISAVFQDHVHYQLSARENIGLSDRDQDEAGIRKAARNAGIDDVLSSLPSGYDTTLGKWFEDGEELSVGEWQKVALARAFVRDAQLLVLDEPTSALDATAEAEIFERFYAMAAHRAAVVITHRLSTVKIADRIYVLSEGRVVETGSHDDLIDNDAIYAQLYQRQARPYRS